jgi:hypothetical protein
MRRDTRPQLHDTKCVDKHTITKRRTLFFVPLLMAILHVVALLQSNISSQGGLVLSSRRVNRPWSLNREIT